MLVKENAENILSVLVNQPPDYYTEGPELQKLKGLTPEEINDAVDILEKYGYVKVFTAMGTVPYHFKKIILLPRGRYKYEQDNRIKGQ
ncbi:MAG: hypothetical protein EF806_03835 [Candidatus Methanoliparum thermophilum]|uniref:Lrp/AsnC family transcriptional regulator n=1 Tax=Methanoliparum thermophilum TaxID=2491083 RepID=A0A520KRU4_METT2|nr:hypothetical protein [Candidatus Methanoliparum sp. LAM-1]RZN64485.1 MAG: hypothetical protein EF806_03835 [Candidatus Methanoliparum thermophilum]BDC35925.1 hypothetical protein MTLP_06070 [Candidatus Methanoliparum sp. LAM-1]